MFYAPRHTDEFYPSILLVVMPLSTTIKAAVSSTSRQSHTGVGSTLPAAECEYFFSLSTPDFLKKPPELIYCYFLLASRCTGPPPESRLVFYPRRDSGGHHE